MRERKGKRHRGKYQHLEGATLPSSLSHGEAGLDPFDHYVEPPAETREAWVYGGGGAQVLSNAGGPCVPHACEMIRRVLYGILRAGFQHATTLVPPLASTVLWP
jgi:hypothetical protein